MRYSLDENDRLTDVDDDWERFAIANGAPHLLRSDVVGSQIWAFIADTSTRQLWELLFGSAREKGHVELNIRCDAPSARRHLRLTITSRESGALDLVSTELHVEERPRQLLLDSSIPRDPSFLKICSWCKRVDVHGDWLEVETAAQTLRFLEMHAMPALTHGICPECRERVLATIASPGRGA